MKKILTIGALLFVFQMAVAQNMIPNGDWELGPTESSDPFTGWLSNGPPDGWTNIATPDRIVFGSPATSRDGHAPQSGDAYCIFYGPGFSEGGKCELNYSLEAGKTYYLCYWLDVDDNFDGGPGRMEFIFPGSNTVYTPFVTNTGDWQYFDTTFVAVANADSLILYGDGDNLMKIDNMILDTVDCSSPTNSIVEKTILFDVYPNPVSEQLYFSEQLKEVSLTNSLGQRVIFAKNVQDIYVGDLPKGIYFLQSGAAVLKVAVE